MFARGCQHVYRLQPGSFSLIGIVRGFLIAPCIAVVPLAAQSLPIQSELGAATVSGCSTTPLTTLRLTAPAATSEALRDLIGRAQDAALQGDHVAARDAYAHAAAVAPAEPRIAYYLGREQEALGDPKLAVQSYCRYLSLGSTVPDADEVRGRVARLTPVEDIAREDKARVLFGSAVVLLERGEFTAADSLLSLTTSLLPNAPEALYNRGVARAARGWRDSATADFRRYIALTPGAGDHTAIENALGALPRHVYDPERTFATGMLFPGLGQFRTRRPLRALVALGAMGGAMVLALQWSQEYQLVARRDARGTPSVDSVYATVHPTAAVGYSTAAAVWIAAALESMWYARQTRARSAAIVSRRDGGAARLVMRPLSNARTGVGLGVSWR